MKIIDMGLKSQWYNAIERGTKKTEYREMKDYWITKLLDMGRYGGKNTEEIKSGLTSGTLPLYPYGWTHIRFHNQGRQMVVPILSINIYKGHEIFAIKLGERKKT